MIYGGFDTIQMVPSFLVVIKLSMVTLYLLSGGLKTRTGYFCLIIYLMLLLLLWDSLLSIIEWDEFDFIDVHLVLLITSILSILLVHIDTKLYSLPLS